MEALAREFAQGAHFLFVYTREAHPGEVFPPHASYDQKLRHVRAFHQRGLGQHRTVLIDSPDGTAHRLYGGVSNMSWIIDHTGRVAYKATWTDAEDIRHILEEVLKAQEIKRGGGRASPFYREVMGSHIPHPGDEHEYLGGRKALEDVRRYGLV